MTPEQRKAEISTKFDVELSEFIQITDYCTEPPIIPPEITFPFMIVFHRKKISVRNNNYLVGCAIFNIGDLMTQKRNLAHKGWPNMTLMFDLPDFMIDDQHRNRYVSWCFQNWDDIERALSENDKQLIPDLKKLFSCPGTQIKEKKGQFKLIF